MSLLAGYDLLIEISNSTLLNLVKANFKIQGAYANPPFEISIPIIGSGAKGLAHLIATDLKLNLNADDTVTLKIIFSNASISLSTPLSISLSKLAGDITLTAPISLANVGSTTKKGLGIDLKTAKVQLSFTAAAQNEIKSKLSATNFTYDLFAAFANQALKDYINKMGMVSFPLGFDVIAGKDGSLTQFEKLEVHCIEDQNPSKQALGLFGILLVANHNKGDHTKKTTSAITSSHGIALSISPEVFRKVLLCPMLANYFLPKEYAQDNAGAINQMPTPCGTSGGFNVKGITITSMTDSFDDGHINLDVTCEKSGTCYEAKGSVHGELTFKTGSTSITPILTTEEPKVNVSIPWYCYLAAAVGIPLGLEAAIIIDVVADSIVSAFADKVIKDTLGKGLPGFSTSKIPDVTFNEVKILKEGLSLLGNMSIDLPTAVTSGIKLQGSVQTMLSQEISSGTFHSTFCAIGDYPYKEYAKLQKGTYTAIATLMGKPLTLTWSICAGSVGGFGIPTSQSSWVIFKDKQGTITIPGAETLNPFPLPTGTSITQDIHIDYTIGDDTIKLINKPDEDNYYFWLKVKAVDPINNQDEYEIQGLFEGDDVEIGGGYYEDEAECLDQLNKKFKAITFMANQDVLEWVPRDYPPQEQLLGFLDHIIQTEDRDADEMFVRLKLIHGHSFYRALGSQEAVNQIAQKRMKDLGR